MRAPAESLTIAREIFRIYADAHDLLPEERERFVAAAAGGNRVLYNEVIAAFAADPGLGDAVVNPEIDRFGVLLNLTDPAGDQSSAPAGAYAGVELQEGRYLLQEELHGGGMGVVYRALDRETQRSCAIKILRPAAIDREWLRERFGKEIAVLEALRHPAIVTVTDRGENTDGQPFFVMPFVEGASLASEIRGGGMDPILVAHIVSELGDALTSVHDRGIFHLDLKPSNILLQDRPDQPPTVMLIDFGIAKIRTSPSGEATEVSKLAGTFPYMAPEHLSGAPSARSDTYALALIAFQMLTGDLLTPAARIEIQSPEHFDRYADRYPQIPKGALAAIAQALAFDPNGRHPSSAAFAQDLAAFLLAAAHRGQERRLWGRAAVIAAFGTVSLLVGWFAWAALSPPVQPSTAAPAVAGIRELLDAYGIDRSVMTANFQLQFAFNVIAVVLILFVPARLYLRGLRIPTAWMYFGVALALIGSWLQFGFAMDNMIQLRAEAWRQLAAAGETARASMFNDGGYVDGWFLAFRQTEHSIDPRFRAVSIFFFCLVYGSLFSFTHACAVALPYIAVQRIVRPARRMPRSERLALKALPWCGLGVLLLAHLQFWLGGGNANWLQELVAIMAVAIGLLLVRWSYHRRVETLL